METMTTLCSRKSVRTYTGENITEEQLQQILKAANAAPVGNADYGSISLTVIQNQELLTKLNENVANMFQKPGIHPLYGAPTLIVVSSKLQRAPMDNVSYSNAATIVHNMILEAVELGIGACHIWGTIMALNNNPDLVKELNLNEGYTPCCAVALGITEEKYEVRDISMDRLAVHTIS